MQDSEAIRIYLPDDGAVGNRLCSLVERAELHHWGEEKCCNFTLTSS